MSAEAEREVRVEPTRCPYCHDGIPRGQAPGVCAACHALHHAACLAEHGACAACGADAGGGRPEPPPEPAAEPEPAKGAGTDEAEAAAGPGEGRQPMVSPARRPRGRRPAAPPKPPPRPDVPMYGGKPDPRTLWGQRKDRGVFRLGPSGTSRRSAVVTSVVMGVVTLGGLAGVAVDPGANDAAVGAFFAAAGFVGLVLALAAALRLGVGRAGWAWSAAPLVLAALVGAYPALSEHAARHHAGACRVAAVALVIAGGVFGFWSLAGALGARMARSAGMRPTDDGGWRPPE